MQNKFQPTSSPHQNQQTFGRSLRSLLKATLKFMVLHPQESAHSPTTVFKDRYASKAGLYPYLPASEEQRDWLEQLYHRQ